ncbi:MAG: CDP-alcohol phosphatidyltransferase family protein [Gammaproteobacteria bacterium]
MIKKIKNILPNFFTFLNVASGFIAIILAFSALSIQHTYFFNYAFYAIVLCIVFDIADGFFSRKFNVLSEIGAKLDSKSDAVSFGVAPACLLAFIGVAQLHGIWFLCSVIIALIYLCSALYRLAQFDLKKVDEDKRGHLYFSGFPSPAAALLCAASSLALITMDTSVVLVLFIYGVAAYLMNSNFKYADLPKHYLYRIRNPLELIAVILFFLFMPLAHAVMLLISIYAIIPVLQKNFNFPKK